MKLGPGNVPQARRHLDPSTGLPVDVLMTRTAARSPRRAARSRSRRSTRLRCPGRSTTDSAARIVMPGARPGGRKTSVQGQAEGHRRRWPPGPGTRSRHDSARHEDRSFWAWRPPEFHFCCGAASRSPRGTCPGTRSDGSNRIIAEETNASMKPAMQKAGASDDDTNDGDPSRREATCSATIDRPAYRSKVEEVKIGLHRRRPERRTAAADRDPGPGRRRRCRESAAAPVCGADHDDVETADVEDAMERPVEPVEDVEEVRNERDKLQDGRGAGRPVAGTLAVTDEQAMLIWI